MTVLALIALAFAIVSLAVAAFALQVTARALAHARKVLEEQVEHEQERTGGAAIGGAFEESRAATARIHADVFKTALQRDLDAAAAATGTTAPQIRITTRPELTEADLAALRAAGVTDTAEADPASSVPMLPIAPERLEVARAALRRLTNLTHDKRRHPPEPIDRQLARLGRELADERELSAARLHENEAIWGRIVDLANEHFGPLRDTREHLTAIERGVRELRAERAQLLAERDRAKEIQRQNDDALKRCAELEAQLLNECHAHGWERLTLERQTEGQRARLAELTDWIASTADEAFGPFPVQSVEDNRAAIERGIFDLRQKLEQARAELADAKENHAGEIASLQHVTNLHSLDQADRIAKLTAELEHACAELARIASPARLGAAR